MVPVKTEANVLKKCLFLGYQKFSQAWDHACRQNSLFRISKDADKASENQISLLKFCILPAPSWRDPMSI